MEIHVNTEYLSIKPFDLENLPDFIVLTGENGTGKTQLLQYLAVSQRGYLSEESDLPEPPMSAIVSGENGEEIFIDPAYIKENDRLFSNIVFRGVQTPNAELGDSYNHNVLLQKGENLAIKHTFYRNQQRFHKDRLSLAHLKEDYEKRIDFKKSARSFSNDTVSISEFTQEDLNIIQKIESLEHKDSENNDPYYYIAFQPVPSFSLFSANLRFLYIQYWARKQANMSVGEPPWEVFNGIAKHANFKYSLATPNLDEQRFDVKLKDSTTGRFISPNTLSSGEKVVFSLIMAMYTTNSMEQLPDAILFDEPDAYLHPSYSKIMLDVIKNVLVGQHGIKVIISTHSPTTVALSPEFSVYKMEDGVMKKTSKKDAILSLTKGLNDLSIYYDKVRQVLVEADNDTVVYSRIYKHALDWQQQDLLDKSIRLKIVNVGNATGGGCTMVNKVIDTLAEENSNLYGIIDWDGKNDSDKRRIVLGGKKRYAIDNYILDPLALSLLFLANPDKRTEIGFDANDQLMGFATKTHAQKQGYINNIISLLEDGIGPIRTRNKNPHEYEIMNGEKFTIPQWFCEIQGHQLYDDIQKIFKFLNRYTDEKSLYTVITDTSYGNYPEIIPMDIVKTLKQIQELV